MFKEALYIKYLFPDYNRIKKLHFGLKVSLRMKQFLKILILIIKSVFFIPHIVCYILSSNKHLIKEDISANIQISKNWLYNLVWLLENNKYFRTLFYYRIGVLSRFISWYTKGESTFILSPHVKIKGGIKLNHPFATIINAKSIGCNFSCRQCTTIGNKIDGRNDLVPTIGDNVIVGANVVIIGDVNIGNNVIIGAGCVVVKDIPSDSVVVGNPMRIIK